MKEKICCFFGHRDTPSEIAEKLEKTVANLIENKQVHTFYVGSQGGFDAMAYSVLKKLKQKYQHINYSVVLAYLPTKKVRTDYFDTVYPDVLDGVPRRFAIDRRNRWLVDKADYVVAYVAYPFGGAAKFCALAEKRKKTVINLYDFS